MTIARGEESATYPARSLVVLAANTCPCGKFHGLSGGACDCSEVQRAHYLRKLSGPIVDRVDIWMEVRPQARRTPGAWGSPVESSEDVRARVADARARQARRYRDRPWSLNSSVPGVVLDECWPLEPDAQHAIDQELADGRLTRRGLTRVQRLAWTVADCAGVARPGLDAARVALALRSSDPARSLPARAGRGGRVVTGVARRAGGRPAGPGRAELRRRAGRHDDLPAGATSSGPDGHWSRSWCPSPGADWPSGWPRSIPRASSSRPTGRASASSSPGDPEWPTGLDDLDHVDQLDHRDPTTESAALSFGGTPPGIWVRGPMPLTELARVGRRGRLARGVGLRGGDDPSDRRAPRAGGRCPWCRGAPSASTSSPTTPPCWRAARPSRCSRAAWTGSTRRSTAPCWPTSPSEFAVVSEQPPGSGPDPAEVPGPQPADRGADPRHGAGRGGTAQRRAQHRPVGGADEPTRHVRARAGHQLHLDGRAPAPAERRRDRGHPRLRGAGGDRRDRGTPRRGAPRPRTTSRPAEPGRADGAGAGAVGRPARASTASPGSASCTYATRSARWAGWR